MNDALPHMPEPGSEQRPESDSTDLQHARNTGTNWGKHAASELLLAFRDAAQTSKEKAANLGAELQRLRSLIAETHGQALSEEWHRAALSAFGAGLPSPE